MLLALTPLPAIAQDQPLSASDWLSGSVRGPVRESSAWRPGDTRPPVRKTPRPSPVATSGEVGAVSVTRLDHGNPDATGILSPRRAGLPVDLWAGSDPATVAGMVLETPARLQSMQGLLTRILTAQLAVADGPSDGARGQLFLARADRLLDMGAVDQAQGLLLAAGPGEPEIFRRLFDIALLEGDESRACAIMDGTPGIAPSFAARIFCLAQTGDWSAAAISLHGAEMLDLVHDREAQLLTYFLDDAYVDHGEALAPPENLSPLEFRISEAIGQPLPTTPLPVAFAQSDLRLNSGFKARLEAAERLARAGALSPGRLRRIYGEQPPAASGGVWDRAAALAELDAAIAAGDHDAALLRCFQVFRQADMADILASMIAADLPEPAPEDMGDAAETARLLRQWQGLSDAPLPAPPADLTAQIPPAPAARKGEALLTAMADIDAAIEGDMARAAKGIAMLIALGLPEDASRARRQIILLDRIGAER
ncbi:hypothetical protein [Paracoccus sp. PARArs4]|uniref:hypothetical protein n=1 Tax=Paracoccus sp. PARArs4 TaxID=2853442 RepID=UPI0024A670A1|nr:hypothetical protein [Paracoccus sp. PARArs4]